MENNIKQNKKDVVNELQQNKAETLKLQSRVAELESQNSLLLKEVENLKSGQQNQPANPNNENLIAFTAYPSAI